MLCSRRALPFDIFPNDHIVSSELYAQYMMLLRVAIRHQLRQHDNAPDNTANGNKLKKIGIRWGESSISTCVQSNLALSDYQPFLVLVQFLRGCLSMWMILKRRYFWASKQGKLWTWNSASGTKRSADNRIWLYIFWWITILRIWFIWTII